MIASCLLQLVGVAVAVALATGCSSSEPTASGASARPSAGGLACGTIEVPSHEGLEVMATGLDCAMARQVVLGAVGRGRAAYRARGFSCTPSEAPAGDTFYACADAQGNKLSFRYGAT